MCVFWEPQKEILLQSICNCSIFCGPLLLISSCTYFHRYVYIGMPHKYAWNVHKEQSSRNFRACLKPQMDASHSIISAHNYNYRCSSNGIPSELSTYHAWCSLPLQFEICEQNKNRHFTFFFIISHIYLFFPSILESLADGMTIVFLFRH